MKNMQARTRGAGLGVGGRSDASIGGHTHVCAFFNSRDEEYSILLPFVKEGIEKGGRALHIVASDTRSDHLRRLEQCGIPQAEASRTEQLIVFDWADTRTRDGGLDQAAMLDRVEAALRRVRSAGHRRTRIIAHVEWPAGQRLDQLVAYDHSFNQRIAPFDDDAVVCVYDVARFGAGVAMDVMRTHPMVIIGGVMHVNPFFVPPEDFLEEMGDRARRAGIV